MADDKPTSTRRNVLKKGAAATTVAVGGVAATSGSAAAAEHDGSITVSGEGNYTVKIEASNIDEQVEGVYNTTSIENGVWVIEGKVNGEVNGDPNEYAFFLIEGYESFVSSESDDGVDVSINIY